MAKRNILDNKKIRVSAWIVSSLFVIAACICNFCINLKNSNVQYLNIQTKVTNLINNATAIKSKWLLNEPYEKFDNIPNRTINIFEKYDAAFYVLENDSIILWWGDNFTKDITPIISNVCDSIVDFSNCKLIISQQTNNNRSCALVIVLERNGKQNQEIFNKATLIKADCDSLNHSQNNSKWQKITFGSTSFLTQADTHTHPPYLLIILGWIGALGVVLLIVREFIVHINRKNAIKLNFYAFATLIAIRALLYFSPFTIFNTESYFYYYSSDIENFAFSPISLLINITFILLQSFIYFCTISNVQRNFSTVSAFKRKFYFFGSLFFRTLMLIYFHWAIVANIYNENVNVNLFDIFSTNSPGLILYICCGVYLIARLLQNNILDNPNYKKRYISDVLYSIPMIVILLWLLRENLHGTWYIAVIYSISFRTIGFLTKQFKQSTLFFTATLITSLYVTSLVVIESRNAREDLAKEYIYHIANNEPITINPNQTLLNNFSYAFVNHQEISIAENNQTPLWSIIPHINRDTTIYVGKYKNVITPLNGRSLVVSYKYISILNIISLVCYIYFLLAAIGIILSLALGLRLKKSAKNSFGILAQIQTTIVSVSVIVVVSAAIVSINYSVDNTNLANRKIINSLLQTVQSSIKNYQNSDINPIKWIEGWYSLSGRALMQNLSVYGVDGRIIMGHPNDFHNYYIDQKALSVINKDQKPYFGEVTHIDGQLYYTLFFPVNHDDKFFGYISISFTAPVVVANARPIVVELLNLFIIILFVVILVSLLVNYWMTKPLRTIQSALKKVSLMRKIPLHKDRVYNYEVNELISAYNDMIETIKKNNIEIAKIERQSAWQEIAKQVAHDIKNPLTPIQLKIQILQKKLERNSPDLQDSLKESLEIIFEQMQRINNVVENFKQFAYSTTLNNEEVELSKIIANEVAMYNQFDNVNVTFENRTNGDVFIIGDKTQMGRVIGNLCKNAIEATSGCENALVRFILSKTDQNAIIEVIDNGIGITDEIAKRIFEPSFTTKAVGSGLGLPICKRIIEEFGGTISFTNNYENGVIFRIELPLS